MLLLYFALALLFGSISVRLGWLSPSGSVVASAFGVSLLWIGGWTWVLPVLVFFASSSLLSKMNRKAQAAQEKAKKGDDSRNGVQVISNGGVAWVMLIGYGLYPEDLWYAGFIGAIAAATADTWATEIGRLAGGHPRHILTGRRMPPGRSGGITWQGTAASVMGAALIGALNVLFCNESCYSCLILGSAAGTLGSLVDSLLGGTVQAVYLDRVSGERVEDTADPGQANLIRGLSWMTNDVVNVGCTLAGSLAAMAYWLSV